MIGSKEIGFTVVSMSTSLIAVFIPILLMGGIVGRLFREFAVTLSAAIMVSLVVSITTTPMLSAKFLKANDPSKHGFLYRMGEKALAWMTGEYERALRAVLRRQPLVLAITVATFLLTVYLYTIVPKGFFPQQDTGRLSAQIRGQQDVSFLALQEKANALVQIVRQEPGVKNVMMFLGGGPVQEKKLAPPTVLPPPPGREERPKEKLAAPRPENNGINKNANDGIRFLPAPK